MQQIWSLQEAQHNLSQVIENAIQNGTQVVTKDGVEVAVVLAYTEYRRLVVSPKKLSEFFRASPLSEVDIDIYRATSEI